MQIYGPAQLHGPQSLSAPHNARVQPNQPTRSTQAADEVHISAEAEMIGQMSEMQDVRQDRISSIRAAIADGTYETSDKLDRALDRLLDEIG